MTRALTLVFVLLALCVAGAAYAQEEVHYEGYTVGSDPSANGTQLTGRGLVTKLYSPLFSNPIAFEYTWVVGNLFSQGSVLADSQYTTNYTCNIPGLTSYFRIYEDPTHNADGTFYNCPSDIQGADPRYSDGVLYLYGHFVNYQSTFDLHGANYGQGTFQGNINWDGGAPQGYGQLPANQHGGWTFGGSTKNQFSCIPKVADGNLSDYDQAMTGRIFRVITKIQSGTWGQLRQLYK